jgi:hypothetical protein
MKLLCIKESGYFLTPGKIYDVEVVVDPSGRDLFSYWVYVREKKLKDLGI